MEFKKETYTQAVVDYIKEALLNGTYSPGTKLNEVVIAESLSLSRAPVREALQILIKEGLVIWVPQRGKFIRKLTPKQIEDSYFAGGVMEAAAVCSSISKYTPENIRELERILECMRNIGDQEPSEKDIAKIDDLFHEVLFSRIDNELLLEFCNLACRRISKFLLFRYWINLYTPSDIYWRHKNIVEALKKGDVYELESCLRNHYIDAGRKLAEKCRQEEK